MVDDYCLTVNFDRRQVDLYRFKNKNFEIKNIFILQGTILMPQTRQLAAIMFTDIVGYTVLMGNDEKNAFSILDKNRSLQKPIIEQFNGRWIKELGDGVMASFNTAIEEVCGTHTIIWGGNAGDDLIFRETVVFTNHQSTKRGILLLVLNGDKIIVKGLAASGQKAVGTEKTITKTKRDWVYEIDDQPAAEMVLKYLGLNLTQEEAETFNPTDANVVLSVSRNNGKPVLRGVGQFNWKDKSIYILGSIKEGDKIRLTLPPDFEVVEEVSENAERIKQEEMPETDALLMFSCIGRLGQFGPLIGDEIESVQKVFNVPIAGFFTYGEFGRTKNGNNEFHNNTCCWVALKEKT